MLPVFSIHVNNRFQAEPTCCHWVLNKGEVQSILLLVLFYSPPMVKKRLQRRYHWNNNVYRWVKNFKKEKPALKVNHALGDYQLRSVTCQRHGKRSVPKVCASDTSVVDTRFQWGNGGSLLWYAETVWSQWRHCCDLIAKNETACIFKIYKGESSVEWFHIFFLKYNNFKNHR